MYSFDIVFFYSIAALILFYSLKYFSGLEGLQNSFLLLIIGMVALPVIMSQSFSISTIVVVLILGGFLTQHLYGYKISLGEGVVIALLAMFLGSFLFPFM